MLYIHIGKGKTATTFLQNEIYTKHSDINYIAKTDNDYPEWLIKWHYLDDITFKKHKHDITKILNSYIKESKVNLISSEAFSIVGNLYGQAKRIYEVNPKSKIIITVREPLDAILSFYKFNIQENIIYNSLEGIIDWDRTPMVYYKRKLIYLPDFYYDEIIEVYQNLFGMDNVCILRYEDMTDNPDVFFIELSDFIGIDLDIEKIKVVLNKKVNKSPNKDEIDLLRVKNLYNKLMKEFPNSNIKLDDIVVENKPLMSDELKEKIINNIKGKCFGYY